MRKACLLSIHALAKADPRVVFIGSDITKRDLEGMATEFPDRFFLEGVYEQHLVGMAAGLALSGKIVFLNTIASFLTGRCFEQVRIDLGLHRANVRLLGSGGGTVYAPLGPTHLANDDIALMRAIPNMGVVAPCDAIEMEKLMRASLDWDGPLYIRIAKGGDPIVTTPDTPFAIGQAVPLRTGRHVGFVTTGVTTQQALAAADLLAARGIEAGVLHLHTIKPLDTHALADFARAHGAIVVAEEHARIGGLGSAVADALIDSGTIRHVRIACKGFPDAFIDRYGSQRDLMTEAGLTAPALAQSAQSLLAAP
jgi:transketolase